MRLLAFLLALLLLLAPAPVRAEEPWADEPGWKALVSQELKVLHGLLDRALKKDYRRQAWYFADRILQVDPLDTQAVEVMDRWSGEELQAGQDPSSSFVKRRDKMLRELGDAYFHFGETLEASGMDPVKYYPINIRAHAYGSQAGNLLRALDQAGYVWLGVYGAKPRAEVEQLLGEDMASYTFPAEFDDDYLKARAVWPEARGAITGTWRLLSDHGYKEVLRLLRSLAEAEAWMVDRMGSKARDRDPEITDLYVFSEHQAYDRIGRELIHERDRERFTGSSGFHDRYHDRLLVCWRHRHNPWLGDDDLMLGHAAKVMARRHLAGGAGGRVQGKGYWLLEGLRGAFEGFRLDDRGQGTIDPAACWRLAVARSLRERELLMPWEEFIELDERAARALDRPTLQVKFGGDVREAKEVDVVAAQATAFVVGVMKSDGGKRMKQLAKLVGDLYKRDSLPDLDRALRLRRGEVAKLADEAMDAAHGMDAR